MLLENHEKLLRARLPNHRSRRFRWSGGEAHCVEAGEGPPLVLLHGGMGELLQWLPILPALASARRVIAIDRPGQGLSDPFPYDAHVDIYDHAAEFVRCALDALGLEKATLVGNSMGGLWCVAFALRHPERVEQLVLVGAPAGSRRWIPQGTRLFRIPLVRRLLRAAIARGSVKSTREAYGRTLVAHPERLDDELLLALTLSTQRNLASTWGLWDAVLGPSGHLRPEIVIGERWRKLSMPVTFVWGEKDAFDTPEHGEELARRIPGGARSIRVRDAGHLPWLDEPELVAAHVLDATSARRARPVDAPSAAPAGVKGGSARAALLGAVAALVTAASAAAGCVGDSTTPTDAGQDQSVAPDVIVTDSPPPPSCDGGNTCGAQCVDLQSDAKNCGACGHACNGSYACIAGQCGDLVTDVAAGGDFGCVIHLDKTVSCWGDNVAGQTGTDPSNADDTCGTTKCRQTPTAVQGLADVIQVSAGADHACAVRTDGTVLCWGNNDRGQIARALSIPYAATPAAVALPVGKKAAKVSCGDGAACVRTITNEVYCWGDNRAAVVGLAPSTTPQTTPNQVTFPSTQDVVDLAVSWVGAAGYVHACAIRSDKSVWCWGSDIEFELAGDGESPADVSNGSANVNPVPRQVSAPIPSAFSIAAGWGSSCALGSSGPECWGANNWNELASLAPGNNVSQTTLVSKLPAPDAGAGALVAIFQGGYHELALDGTGQLWAWGWNTEGQIGNGANSGAVSCDYQNCVDPTVALTNVAHASAGYTFSLALETDGSVMAWGSNDHAELAHLPNAASSGDEPCGSATCNPTPKAITNLP